MGYEIQYTRLMMAKYDIKILREKFHDTNEILKKIGEWTLWEYDAVDDLMYED